MQHRTSPLLDVDLSAPGGLDELFTRSRARFGAATMTADTADATTTGATQDAPAALPNPVVTAEDVAKLQKALDSERELRKASDKAAKEGQAAIAEAQKARDASKTDQERAVEAARREGESAATARTNGRLVNAEARALASGTFHDPTVVARLLDLDDVPVTDEGVVDSAAIQKRLDALAESAPYLLKTAKPPVADPGRAGVGAGGTTVRPDVQPGQGRVVAAFGSTNK